MPYAVRQFTCSGCGQLITRRAAAEAKPRCAPCGIKIATAVMIQLHRRDGDAYEQWLLASIESAQRKLIAYRARKAYEDPLKGLGGPWTPTTPTPGTRP